MLLANTHQGFLSYSYIFLCASEIVALVMPLQGPDHDNFLSVWCHTECEHLGLVSRHFIDHRRASFRSKRKVLTTEAVLMFPSQSVFCCLLLYLAIEQLRYPVSECSWRPIGPYSCII